MEGGDNAHRVGTGYEHPFAFHLLQLNSLTAAPHC